MNIQALVETIKYVNQFRGKTFLIKLGGSILHDDNLIKVLCDDLQLLQQAGIKIVLVHGGSKAINHYLQQANIESKFVDGLRVTNKETMTVIEMVLCGHVNKLLVRKLNAIGVHAVGIAGSDNQMLLCDHYSHEHGYVGRIKSANTELLNHFFSKENTMIPVIAPIGVNDSGCPMNINADLAASYIATQLQVDKLIFLTDQDGISDQNGELITEASKAQLNALIADKTVTGGMLTKVKAVIDALNSQLNHVHILNGLKPHVLIEEIFTVHGTGTLCVDHQQQQKEAA